jgi:YHS domain-containing protein
MEFVRKHLRALVATILVFSACGIEAQTPPSSEPRVVLKGYDPVAYFTDSKPVKGTPSINYDWDEGRYQFSNARNKQTFASNPDRYAPQFAGFCTAGMAKGIKAEANPEIFMVVDGKLYTFSSLKARDAAQADPMLFARAAKNWQEKK